MALYKHLAYDVHKNFVTGLQVKCTKIIIPHPQTRPNYATAALYDYYVALRVCVYNNNIIIIVVQIFVARRGVV